jgi:hypothetical protein
VAKAARRRVTVSVAAASVEKRLVSQPFAAVALI